MTKCSYQFFSKVVRGMDRQTERQRARVRTHTHTHTHTHSHTLSHTHSHSHTLTHSHTDTLTHSHTHSHSLTHSHTDTLTHTRTNTLTFTHTHTHTLITIIVISYAYSLPLWKNKVVKRNELIRQEENAMTRSCFFRVVVSYAEIVLTCQEYCYLTFCIAHDNTKMTSTY